jgi:hypothetical protein
VIALIVALCLAAGWFGWAERRSRSSSQPPQPDDDPATLRAAYEALEEIGIALERHRAERGTFPDELTALVPEYLEALPGDPFDGSGATLKYVSPPGNPEGRILYSLGPDGIDQGGSPRDPITAAGDLPYPVR